jgi:hypothetical protein
MILRSSFARSAWARIAALLALILAGPSAAPANESLEFAVKATFLLRFGDFVTWPETAFSGPADPVTICIVGTDPFGTFLPEATKGQTIHGRPVAIADLAELPSPTKCHIAYMGASSTQSVAARLKAMKDMPVLTVTDGRVDEAAGMIKFVIQDNRVRFAIDPDAAEASGIGISSKLLALAINLKP